MIRVLLLGIASLVLVGCPRKATTPEPPKPSGDVAPTTNRIDAPATVRQNLGITFATAQERAVSDTRRYPGVFAYLPDARRSYVTPVAGRLELLRDAHDVPVLRPTRAVRAGDGLFRVVSPMWHTMQRDIAMGLASVEEARAEVVRTASELNSAPERMEALARGLDAARSHVSDLEGQTAALQKRIARLEPLVQQTRTQLGELEQAMIDMALIRSSISDAREQHAEFAQKRIELAAQLEAPGSGPSVFAAAAAAKRAHLASATARLDSLLAEAAALHGLSAAQMLEPIDGGLPRWQALSAVLVRASAPGIVLMLAPVEGAWVAERTEVATTADPAGLVFEAYAPQGELAWLRGDLVARVAMPDNMGVAPGAAVEGALAIGGDADPHARTVPLFLVPRTGAHWARAGMAAWLEVNVQGGPRVLAIPRAAVIRDGLVDIFFRRDPRNPDKLIRIEGDLGLTEGKWIEVKSGLAEGDEVVVSGVYPLMLANSGQQRKGGHFHSDGTFHDGSD